MTREELVTLVRDALEASDVCCHAGSPRGISAVYDYIPTVDAAEIAVDVLLSADPEDQEPRLGYATTRALLEEIQARGEIAAGRGPMPDIARGLEVIATLMLDGVPDGLLDARPADR